MARLTRALVRSTLGGLALLSAGCAQFQWTEVGPGAPGQRMTQAPSAPITNERTLPRLDEEEPEPFAPAEYERIAEVQPYVDRAATKYAVDPDLINGVIYVESRFDRRAKSPAGARGLMQLMPATANALARELGRPVAKVYDPEFNIEAGSLYLLQMLDRFDGDETLALAAYNAGAGNVSKWMREDGQLPPRSIEYVEHVQRARLRFVAMRERQQGEQPATMIATAPPREPEPQPEPTPASTRKSQPVVPPPPKPAVTNPLAPSPDVYKPEPTPEPPLAETPWPPKEDRTPTRWQKQEDDESDELAPAGTLPSVLD